MGQCGRSDPAAAFVSGMLNAGNIFLVGPMGSGKSAVGRLLAQRLDLAFVDSDAEIEARTGVDIAYIFEREGEAGFRVREAEVLDDITQRPGVLVATGGGAVLDPGTRERLRSRGCVVYLRTSVDQQLARTRRSAAAAADEPGSARDAGAPDGAACGALRRGGRRHRRHGRAQGRLGRGRNPAPPGVRRGASDAATDDRPRRPQLPDPDRRRACSPTRASSRAPSPRATCWS